MEHESEKKTYKKSLIICANGEVTVHCDVLYAIDLDVTVYENVFSLISLIHRCQTQGI